MRLFFRAVIQWCLILLKNNPILSQRHLPADRPNKVDWAGHADLVQTADGEWYGVFLAVRPNEKNRVNTGRETFVLPVDWSGEWPIFKGGMEPLKALVHTPKGIESSKDKSGFFPNGNFTFNDKLNEKTLDERWIALRGPREKFLVGEKEGIGNQTFCCYCSGKKTNFGTVLQTAAHRICGGGRNGLYSRF